MSRRNVISSLIAEQLAAANSTDTPVHEALPRVAAGPVRSMGLTLDRLELERKSLEDALAAGAAILELDPAQIGGSFAADRFVDETGAAFEDLKRSIAENGQEVPILVRLVEGHAGQYQVAYGHRRLRACAALGRKVRALVRPLSDAELVVAQGLENAARVDLTFIEKAVFAQGLEGRGFERATIMASLSTDKTELSKLISTARALPEPVVRAIGAAPRVGRRRWMQLAELLTSRDATKRVEAAIAADGFATRDSNTRFSLAFAAAAISPIDAARRLPHRMDFKAPDGEILAKVSETDGQLSLVVDRSKHLEFADFLVQELPDLHRRFMAGQGAPVWRSRR
jgi:ParB family transcriptional regulator, chromosome partitioning protein